MVFVPFILFGITDELQVLQVPLFRGYKDREWTPFTRFRATLKVRLAVVPLMLPLQDMMICGKKQCCFHITTFVPVSPHFVPYGIIVCRDLGLHNRLKHKVGTGAELGLDSGFLEHCLEALALCLSPGPWMQARASREEIPLLYSSTVHVGIRMGAIKRMFYWVRR